MSWKKRMEMNSKNEEAPGGLGEGKMIFSFFKDAEGLSGVVRRHKGVFLVKLLSTQRAE
jgi:hypothetical protein